MCGVLLRTDLVVGDLEDREHLEKNLEKHVITNEVLQVFNIGYGLWARWITQNSSLQKSTYIPQYSWSAMSSIQILLL